MLSHLLSSCVDWRIIIDDMAASANFNLLDEQARFTIAQLRLVVQGIERAVSLYQTKSNSDLLSTVQRNVNESLKVLEVWLVKI